MPVLLLQGRRGGQQDFGEAVGASAPAPAAPAPNAWRQAKPAIEPPHPPAVQALPQPRSLTPPLALPPPSPGAVTPSAQPQPEASRSLVDMGLLLGQSSRVGWAPSGVFAQISESPSFSHHRRALCLLLPRSKFCNSVLRSSAVETAITPCSRWRSGSCAAAVSLL